MSSLGLLRSWYHRLDAKGHTLRPTIHPTPGFSASADAERLHRAIKGIGTDEDTLINVLASRTNYERQEICATYLGQYKRTLRDDLKSDTSGNFQMILCELINDIPYLYAKALFYAMKGVGTNERALIEILGTLSNDEIVAVSAAYKKVLKDKNIEDSKRSLESDLDRETSGDFREALLLLVSAHRDEIPALQLKEIPKSGVDSVINKELAESDAKDLHQSGVGKIGTAEKRLTRIVCGRTTFQLAADAEAYEKAFKRSLLNDMMSELSGDYRRLVITLIRYANDRSRLLAEWLHDTMTGLGTRDYTLMRLIISRSEIDLEDIKVAYENIYGESLIEAITNDTSGDYRKTLVKLLG